MKNLYKSLLLLLTLSALYTFLSSHEFWLEPAKFIYKAGEPVSIKFLVGENFEGENWKGNRQTIQYLHLYYNGVEDDLAGMFTDSTYGDSLYMQFFDEGTTMVTFNSANKFIELDSAKFLEYLKEDGLQNAIDYRAEHGETDSAGREYYQRSVKTIFQVGAKQDDTYKINTTLPVDIIPLSHPYSLKNGQSLQVKIFFLKEPLANAAVKIWHKLNGKTEKQEVMSDSSGIIKFPVNPSGNWMVSTVKMIRLKNDSTAQWQSYWGSLTWGYSK
jgi:uncharacterized GH25 family protein